MQKVEYQKISDEELLLLLKADDPNSFKEIYDRYNGPLYVFAYKRLKDRENSKDVVHELFLKLWSDRDMLSDRFVLSAYLYSSLRNRIINIITHQKVEERYIDSFRKYIAQHSTDNTDHLLRHNDLAAFIENEIANLHPRMRKVFELSRKMNLTRKEIAMELSISEETVKSHMHGALKILKDRLLGTLFHLLF